MATNNNKHIIINEVVCLGQLHFLHVLFNYQVRFYLYLVSHLYLLTIIYQI